MQVILSRIVGAIVAALVAAIVHMIHLDGSNPDQANLIQSLTTGMTTIGMAVAMIVYAMVHKAISSKINPTDTASKHVTGVSSGIGEHNTNGPLGTPVEVKGATPTRPDAY